jgi:hypothetical protein
MIGISERSSARCLSVSRLEGLIFYPGGVSSTRALAAACAAAVVLAGCASLAKPSHGRGRVLDPRTAGPNYLGCLRANHLAVTEIGTDTLQVGTPPTGATIVFAPTADIAEGDQIEGRAQGAYVVGAALVYPNSAPGSQLTVIENCLAQGVKEPKA